MKGSGGMERKGKERVGRGAVLIAGKKDCFFQNDMKTTIHFIGLFAFLFFQRL